MPTDLQMDPLGLAAKIGPDYMESDATGGGFALRIKGRSSTDTRRELSARSDHVVGIYGDAAQPQRARAVHAHGWVSDPIPTAACCCCRNGFTVEAAKRVDRYRLSLLKLPLADRAGALPPVRRAILQALAGYVGSARLRY